MLACKVFLSDQLLAHNNQELMRYVEKQVLKALVESGGDPLRVLWMQEEESHSLPDGLMGRFRVYFEVRP